MKGFQEEMEEFEQMLENRGRKAALIQYYRTHVTRILLGVVSVGILLILILSNLPVWARYAVIIALLGVNYLYGRYKKNGS